MQACFPAFLIAAETSAAPRHFLSSKKCVTSMVTVSEFVNRIKHVSLAIGTDVGKDPAEPRPIAHCLRIRPRLRNHWSNATRPAVTGFTFASTTDRVAAGLCAQRASSPRSKNPHEHRLMNAETGTVVHRRRCGSELECRTRLTCRGVVSCFPAFVVQAAGCGKPGMLSEENPHILGAQTLPTFHVNG